MVWVTESRPVFSIQSIMEKIVSTGELTRREHMRLTSTILADYKLTEEDRRYISRILDYVQIGRLRLVD